MPYGPYTTRACRRSFFVTPSDSPLTGSECTRPSEHTYRTFIHDRMICSVHPGDHRLLLLLLLPSPTTRGASLEHACAHYPAGHLLLRHRTDRGRTKVILQYRNTFRHFPERGRHGQKRNAGDRFCGPSPSDHGSEVHLKVPLPRLIPLPVARSPSLM